MIGYIGVARSLVSERRTARRQGNLRILERLLSPQQFLQIHRSTIMRIDAVERVKSGQFHSLVAVLNDGTELRVGRTYTAAIRARLARRG